MKIADQFRPHYDSPLEWWYMHGCFTLSDKSEYNFILTIFRNQFQNKGEERKEGYQLILAIQNTDTGSRWERTYIDPVFFKEIIARQSLAKKANIDTMPVEHYLSTAEKEGPPKPIILTEIEPRINDFPFRFNWENINLDFLESQIKFSLVDASNGLDISISSKINPLIDIYRDNPGSTDKYGMSYLVLPRMVLSGTFNDQLIKKGTAWLDHQWGNYEWLYERGDKGRIKGWIWLGINLDGGTDLIIWQHREAETAIITDSMAVLIRENRILSFTELKINPVEKWYSHKTDCYFPLRSRIKIPELSAEMVFTPFHNDQEISVFGPMRSVWQGAGFVTGQLDGKPVKGPARCELTGYSYIHKLKDHMKLMARRVDDAIEAFLPRNPGRENLNEYIGEAYWKHEPVVMEEMICKPVWDLMDRSGKRWRPILSYYLLKALGTDPRPYEQAAFALTELLHTGSLIIDDIQDNSDIRRGDNSIHIKYGQELAITAGNTLYFLPYLLIMNHLALSPEQKKEIMELMNRQLIQAHLGQSMDLFWSRQYSLNGLDPYSDKAILQRFRQIYSLKTGAPVRGLAECAAIISNTQEEVRNACGKFAQRLGIAFQTIDDVNNFSLSDRWGKISGEDLREGNMTYAIAYSLKKMNKPDREYIMALIKSPEKRKDNKTLTEGIEIIRNSGALEECRHDAVSMLENAWNEFSSYLPPSDPKILIRALTDYLIKGNNPK